MSIRPKIAEHIAAIVAELQNAGYETYIVGGAVRDFLLERQPKDYDLSTSATPEQIRKVFAKRRVLIIGRRFRLVHLYHGKDIIEISTFRKRPEQSALPEPNERAAQAPENMIFRDNEFGTAEEDAQRRDFTINSIFYDPIHDKLIDHTAYGVRDITAGIVRTIGDPKLRFEEDPVRILRALKLVGQYSFVLEKETEKALHDCMPLIRHASPSRMTLELEKILKNPYGDRILPCFHKFGFLTYFLPFLEEHYNSPQLRYALDLLAKRNERLLAGKYRDSLSLVNAIFTLSFAEARLGKNPPGKLWENYPGIENDFKDLISEIFHPHIVTKRSTAAAIRSLLFQPRFKDPEAAQRFTGTHGYATARELAVIRNALDGTIPDFEGRCPLPDPANSGRRKSRRRGRRRRGKNKAQFISTASAPANGNAAGASQQNQCPPPKYI